ncbi:hypothetical protein [Dysgonomonas capnocytophagoides]|uniref:hypothetical protein n=1 Tax=Dysgonomonas capnocytophagoides TaxID=45254 RepID=UPI003992B8AF
MTPYSNIDLLLTLHPHGWSLAHISINAELLEYDISHIFNDPYSDTIDALLSLIKGNESFFYWFSEPFGIKVELKKADSNELIIFMIYDINKEFYEEIEDKDLIFIKSFEVNLKQLLVLFYYQFKKTCVLLENKEYAMDRSKDFPFQKFRQFETVIKKYCEIN